MRALRAGRARGWLRAVVAAGVLLGLGVGGARAELPDICLFSPAGEPFYVPGQTVWIAWESPSFDPSDPDQAVIAWLSLYWRWVGETTLHFIASRTGDEAASGELAWAAPATGARRDLRIVARYEPSDVGGAIVTQESERVAIVPAGEPAIWVASPLSLAPPTQPQPPVCFDHLVLEGGGMHTALIRWKITGCEGVDEARDWLQIQYTRDGTTYETIDTVETPCAPFNYVWYVPAVNTTRARMRVIWWEDSAARGPLPGRWPGGPPSTPSRSPPERPTGRQPPTPGGISGSPGATG
ncbi:MAG: hypothetical protein Kow0092_20760 [Deferrisomatales bacterium]